MTYRLICICPHCGKVSGPTFDVPSNQFGIRMSEHDRANIGQLIAGPDDHFSAKLVQLIAKADNRQRATLALVYPEHVLLYELWLGEDCPASRAVASLGGNAAALAPADDAPVSIEYALTAEAVERLKAALAGRYRHDWPDVSGHPCDMALIVMDRLTKRLTPAVIPLDGSLLQDSPIPITFKPSDDGLIELAIYTRDGQLYAKRYAHEELFELQRRLAEALGG